MYPQSLEKNTESVLAKIAKSPLAKNFYLAGGTALALQLGHRKSIDLDWFTSSAFQNSVIKTEVSKLGNFKVESEDKNTIHGVLENVKVSFLVYGYPMLYPFTKILGIRAADIRDIAAMKLDAISSRGSKKDFIDLFFLLQKYSLADLINFFEKKFSNICCNKLHMLKSLVYFQDAEAEPMPIMLKPTSWEEIKKHIILEANKILG